MPDWTTKGSREYIIEQQRKALGISRFMTDKILKAAGQMQVYEQQLAREEEQREVVAKQKATVTSPAYRTPVVDYDDTAYQPGNTLYAQKIDWETDNPKWRIIGVPSGAGAEALVPKNIPMSRTPGTPPKDAVPLYVFGDDISFGFKKTEAYKPALSDGTTIGKISSSSTPQLDPKFGDSDWKTKHGYSDLNAPPVYYDMYSNRFTPDPNYEIAKDKNGTPLYNPDGTPMYKTDESGSYIPKNIRIYMRKTGGGEGDYTSFIDFSTDITTEDKVKSGEANGSMLGDRGTTDIQEQTLWEPARFTPVFAQSLWAVRLSELGQWKAQEDKDYAGDIYKKVIEEASVDEDGAPVISGWNAGKYVNRWDAFLGSTYETTVANAKDTLAPWAQKTPWYKFRAISRWLIPGIALSDIGWARGVVKLDKKLDGTVKPTAAPMTTFYIPRPGISMDETVTKDSLFPIAARYTWSSQIEHGGMAEWLGTPDEWLERPISSQQEIGPLTIFVQKWRMLRDSLVADDEEKKALGWDKLSSSKPVTGEQKASMEAWQAQNRKEFSELFKPPDNATLLSMGVSRDIIDASSKLNDIARGRVLANIGVYGKSVGQRDFATYTDFDWSPLSVIPTFSQWATSKYPTFTRPVLVKMLIEESPSLRDLHDEYKREINDLKVSGIPISKQYQLIKEARLSVYQYVDEETYRIETDTSLGSQEKDELGTAVINDAVKKMMSVYAMEEEIMLASQQLFKGVKVSGDSAADDDFFSAYSWGPYPEKKAEYLRGLAYAELQFGRPLSNSEMLDIKDAYLDPVTEFTGQAVLSVWNVLDFIPAPVKFAQAVTKGARQAEGFISISDLPFQAIKHHLWRPTIGGEIHRFQVSMRSAKASASFVSRGMEDLAVSIISHGSVNDRATTIELMNTIGKFVDELAESGVTGEALWDAVRAGLAEKRIPNWISNGQIVDAVNNQKAMMTAALGSHAPQAMEKRAKKLTGKHWGDLLGSMYDRDYNLRYKGALLDLRVHFADPEFIGPNFSPVWTKYGKDYERTKGLVQWLFRLGDKKVERLTLDSRDGKTFLKLAAEAGMDTANKTVDQIIEDVARLYGPENLPSGALRLQSLESIESPLRQAANGIAAREVNGAAIGRHFGLKFKDDYMRYRRAWAGTDIMQDTFIGKLLGDEGASVRARRTFDIVDRGYALMMEYVKTSWLAYRLSFPTRNYLETSLHVFHALGFAGGVRAMGRPSDDVLRVISRGVAQASDTYAGLFAVDDPNLMWAIEHGGSPALSFPLWGKNMAVEFRRVKSVMGDISVTGREKFREIWKAINFLPSTFTKTVKDLATASETVLRMRLTAELFVDGLSELEDITVTKMSDELLSVLLGRGVEDTLAHSVVDQIAGIYRGTYGNTRLLDSLLDVGKMRIKDGQLVFVLPDVTRASEFIKNAPDIPKIIASVSEQFVDFLDGLGHTPTQGDLITFFSDVTQMLESEYRNKLYRVNLLFNMDDGPAADVVAPMSENEEQIVRLMQEVEETPIDTSTERVTELSGDLRHRLEEQGVSVVDASGNQRPVADLVEELQRKLDDAIGISDDMNRTKEFLERVAELRRQGKTPQQVAYEMYGQVSAQRHKTYEGRTPIRAVAGELHKEAHAKFTRNMNHLGSNTQVHEVLSGFEESLTDRGWEGQLREFYMLVFPGPVTQRGTEGSAGRYRLALDYYLPRMHEAVAGWYDRLATMASTGQVEPLTFKKFLDSVGIRVSIDPDNPARIEQVVIRGPKGDTVFTSGIHSETIDKFQRVFLFESDDLPKLLDSTWTGYMPLSAIRDLAVNFDPPKMRSYADITTVQSVSDMVTRARPDEKIPLAIEMAKELGLSKTAIVRGRGERLDAINEYLGAMGLPLVSKWDDVTPEQMYSAIEYYWNSRYAFNPKFLVDKTIKPNAISAIRTQFSCTEKTAASLYDVFTNVLRKATNSDSDFKAWRSVGGVFGYDTPGGAREIWHEYDGLKSVSVEYSLSRALRRDIPKYGTATRLPDGTSKYLLKNKDADKLLEKSDLILPSLYWVSDIKGFFQGLDPDAEFDFASLSAWTKKNSLAMKVESSADGSRVIHFFDADGAPLPDEVTLTYVYTPGKENDIATFTWSGKLPDNAWRRLLKWSGDQEFIEISMNGAVTELPIVYKPVQPKVMLNDAGYSVRAAATMFRWNDTAKKFDFFIQSLAAANVSSSVHEFTHGLIGTYERRYLWRNTPVADRASLAGQEATAFDGLLSLEDASVFDAWAEKLALDRFNARQLRLGKTTYTDISAMSIEDFKAYAIQVDEVIAQGSEYYLMTLKSSSSALATEFENIRQALLANYARMRGHFGDMQMSDTVREFYRKMWEGDIQRKTKVKSAPAPIGPTPVTPPPARAPPAPAPTKFEGKKGGGLRPVESPKSKKPVYTVDRWYDRHTRSWVIQIKDADNFQVGPAVYVNTKSGAIAQEEEWKAAIEAGMVSPEGVVYKSDKKKRLDILDGIADNSGPEYRAKLGEPSGVLDLTNNELLMLHTLGYRSEDIVTWTSETARDIIKKQVLNDDSVDEVTQLPIAPKPVNRKKKSPFTTEQVTQILNEQGIVGLKRDYVLALPKAEREAEIRKIIDGNLKEGTYNPLKKKSTKPTEPEATPAVAPALPVNRKKIFKKRPVELLKDEEALGILDELGFNSPERIQALLDSDESGHKILVVINGRITYDDWTTDEMITNARKHLTAGDRERLEKLEQFTARELERKKKTFLRKIIRFDWDNGPLDAAVLDVYDADGVTYLRVELMGGDPEKIFDEVGASSVFDIELNSTDIIKVRNPTEGEMSRNPGLVPPREPEVKKLTDKERFVQGQLRLSKERGLVKSDTAEEALRLRLESDYDIGNSRNAVIAATAEEIEKAKERIGYIIFTGKRRGAVIGVEVDANGQIVYLVPGKYGKPYRVRAVIKDSDVVGKMTTQQLDKYILPSPNRELKIYPMPEKPKVHHPSVKKEAYVVPDFATKHTPVMLDVLNKNIRQRFDNYIKMMMDADASLTLEEAKRVAARIILSQYEAEEELLTRGVDSDTPIVIEFREEVGKRLVGKNEAGQKIQIDPIDLFSKEFGLVPGWDAAIDDITRERQNIARQYREYYPLHTDVVDTETAVKDIADEAAEVEEITPQIDEVGEIEDAGIPEAEPASAKRAYNRRLQVWEIPKSEFVGKFHYPKKISEAEKVHYDAVRAALDAGKKVPSEVLDAYPEFAVKTAAPVSTIDVSKELYTPQKVDPLFLSSHTDKELKQLYRNLVEVLNVGLPVPPKIFDMYPHLRAEFSAPSSHVVEDPWLLSHLDETTRKKYNHVMLNLFDAEEVGLRDFRELPMPLRLQFVDPKAGMWPSYVLQFPSSSPLSAMWFDGKYAKKGPIYPRDLIRVSANYPTSYYGMGAKQSMWTVRWHVPSGNMSEFRIVVPAGEAIENTDVIKKLIHEFQTRDFGEDGYGDGIVATPRELRSNSYEGNYSAWTSFGADAKYDLGLYAKLDEDFNTLLEEVSDPKVLKLSGDVDILQYPDILSYLAYYNPTKLPDDIRSRIEWRVDVISESPSVRYQGEAPDVRFSEDGMTTDLAEGGVKLPDSWVMVFPKSGYSIVPTKAYTDVMTSGGEFVQRFNTLLDLLKSDYLFDSWHVMEGPRGLEDLSDITTPKFKKFFGNSVTTYKDGPRVGQPRILFHAGPQRIDAFDSSKAVDFGFHSGTYDQAVYKGWRGDTFAMMPVYVRAERPLYLTDVGDWNTSSIIYSISEHTPQYSDLLPRLRSIYEALPVGVRNNPSIRQQEWKMLQEAFEDAGYDSIIYRNNFERLGEKLDEESVLVWRQDQLKSVFNSGAWGRGEPRLLYQGDYDDTDALNVAESMFGLTDDIDDAMFMVRNGEFVSNGGDVRAAHGWMFGRIAQELGKGWQADGYIDVGWMRIWRGNREGNFGLPRFSVNGQQTSLASGDVLIVAHGVPSRKQREAIEELWSSQKVRGRVYFDVNNPRFGDDVYVNPSSSDIDEIYKGTYIRYQGELDEDAEDMLDELWNSYLDGEVIGTPSHPMTFREVLLGMLGDEDALRVPDQTIAKIDDLITDLQGQGKLDLATVMEDVRNQLDYMRTYLVRVASGEPMSMVPPIPIWQHPEHVQSFVAGSYEVTAERQTIMRALSDWGEGVRTRLDGSEPLSPELQESLRASMPGIVKGKAEDVQVAAYGDLDRGGTRTGALPEAARRMVDYSDYSWMEQPMRDVIPFWHFFSRNTGYWAEYMATHPTVLSFYVKYLDLSRRTAIQQGLVNSQGRQLSSTVGYVPIPGTKLWFDPTAPFMFRVFFPRQDINTFMNEDSSAMSPTQEIIKYLVGQSQLRGIALTPIVMFGVLAFGLQIPYGSSAMKYATYTAIKATYPWIDYLPPWTQRSMMSVMRRSTNSPVFDPGATIEPEMEWKDYMIGRLMLMDYLDMIRNTDDESEKQRLGVEVQTIWTAVDKTTESVDTVDGRGIKVAEIWKKYQKEFESSEYYRKLASSIVGFYVKEFTPEYKQLLALRDEINILKDSINSELKAQVLMPGRGPSDRYKYYTDVSYGSADGALWNLYQNINWVKNLETGEAIRGGPDWHKAIAEAVGTDIATTAYYNALAAASEARDIRLRRLPIGYSGPEKDGAWADYWKARVEIETNPMYSLAQRTWYPGLKPEADIQDKLEASFLSMLSETRPQYNDATETYSQYQSRVTEWERNIPRLADELSAVLMLNVGRMLKSSGSRDLDVTGMIDEIVSGATIQKIKEVSKKNDTYLQAANNAWYELYLKKYWEDMEGISGTDARTLAEREWNKKNLPPTLESIWAWVQKEYPGQFTYQQIKSVVAGKKSLTVEERLDISQTTDDNYEEQIWDYLSMIRTQDQREEVDKVLIGLGIDPSWIDSWYDFGGDVRTWGVDSKLKEFVEALAKAIGATGLESPTDDELREKIEAKALNDVLKEEIETATGGDEGARIRALYWYLDDDEAKAWRKANPEKYDKYVKAYYEMRQAYALVNPLWAKYYYPDFDPDNLYGSGSGSGGGSNGYYKSYGSYGYSSSYYGKKSSEPAWIPAYRSTLDARKLLKKYL